MGDYVKYRKRSYRLIRYWLRDKESEELINEIWYVYLLLEKSTIDLRADPISVTHDLWKSDIFNIEEVEKLAENHNKLTEAISKVTSRDMVTKAHVAAIEKAIEIHKNISEPNKSLLKGLGYI